jgi:glycerol uptake facilitator-like aquaporin
MYFFSNTRSLSGVVADAYHACFIEAFGTAFIVFIIFFVTSPLYTIPGAAVPPIAAIAIGAMVAILGPLTGYVRFCKHTPDMQ